MASHQAAMDKVEGPVGWDATVGFGACATKWRAAMKRATLAGGPCCARRRCNAQNFNVACT